MSALRVCAFPGCRSEIVRRHVMCLRHWRLVPLLVRSKVVAAQRRAARGMISPDSARAMRLVAVRCATAIAAKGGAL